MGESKYIYRCSKCGRTEEIKSKPEIPFCCEKIMVKDPLEQCTTTDHPEMVRNYDAGEPCDDNRGKENPAK